MNYVIYINHNKFDLSMVNWLNSNVSLQAVLWKAEIDIFQRRAVYFKNESDSLAFKQAFSL